MVLVEESGSSVRRNQLLGNWLQVLSTGNSKDSSLTVCSIAACIDKKYGFYRLDEGSYNQKPSQLH